MHCCGMTPEAVWGFLLVLLVAAIAWGVIAWLTRDRSLDPTTEEETRKLMDDPGPKPMKGDRKQPPNGSPPTKTGSA